jgi:hypothetical protein
MRALLVSAAMLAVAACSSNKPVYTAEGTMGHAIDCSGLAQTWNACFAQAGEICKEKGYSIISRTGEREAALVAGERSVADYLGPGKVARSMVIKCRA